MQHHIGSRLRQYLLLVRLPNAFTAPSNVLVGYFAAMPAEPSGVHLAALMASSGMLYVAGIALNDYFDVEIDRKERPSRPLPSGAISKSHAMAIAIAMLFAANTIALAVAPAAAIFSAALTAVIIAYNYRLKHGASGPFAMGAARFLNVFLGASPAISVALLAGADVRLELAAFAGASLFAYVVAITLLSRKEVESAKPGLLSFSLVFSVIAAIAAIGFYNLRPEFLVSLAAFAAVMIITLKRHITSNTPSAQKAVRNMVISIIILDSVFVGGTAGFVYGMATLLLILPAAILARKLYVT